MKSCNAQESGDRCCNHAGGARAGTCDSVCTQGGTADCGGVALSCVEAGCKADNCNLSVCPRYCEKGGHPDCMGARSQCHCNFYNCDCPEFCPEGQFPCDAGSRECGCNNCCKRGECSLSFGGKCYEDRGSPRCCSGCETPKCSEYSTAIHPCIYDGHYCNPCCSGVQVYCAWPSCTCCSYCGCAFG